MDDESYLNEVVDEKLDSDSDMENDIEVNNRRSNSENEVSDDKDTKDVASEDSYMKEDSMNIVPDKHGENITDEKSDELVVSANTIEPEEAQKIKKQTINSEVKPKLNTHVGNKGGSSVTNNENKDETSIIDHLPDYQDEDNNIIGEEEENVNVKSQPLLKQKEKQSHLLTENSTSQPTTLKGENEKAFKKVDVGITNGSTSQKNSATTSREFLNEVENESLESDLHQQNILQVKGAKSTQNNISITNNQNNAHSTSKLKKLNSDAKNRNEAIYDNDDTINELGKDPIPVLLNQRAKRHTEDIISNLILFTKRVLRV